MADIHQTDPNIAGARIYIERRRIPASELENQIGADGSPRFGVVRDRLFHAMLVRLSLPYYVNFPILLRRFIEFIILIIAIILLIMLIYTHFLVSSYPAHCLDSIKGNWPKKGIVRVEVIRNLDDFREMQFRKENVSSNGICHFNMSEILRKGKLPAEIRRHKNAENWELTEILENQREIEMKKKGRIGRPMPILVEAFFWLIDKFQKMHLNSENGQKDERIGGIEEEENDEEGEELANNEDEENDGGGILPLQLEEGEMPFYQHLYEFSLYYGLLRLNAEMRNELNLETLVVQLDVEKEECLRNWRERPLMRYLVGLDELVMGSVKELSENETSDRGYLRDLRGGEMYHFVTFSGTNSSTQYFTAFCVMLIFTFSISLLLRFSHDQIFVFIVDLFQMFEQNQPLIFPIAPLLTVILALVGMETIMSEIFNDTSTAFYVILLVWLADQYDAIFCHSPIGRRHWLRMFYLYHFAFYAYQYRYNGIYNGLALLTSAAFTLHSMIYFFHHYELPHIIYQEQLVAAVQHLQNTEGVDGTVDIMRIRQVAVPSPNHEEIIATANGDTNSSGNPEERSLRIALSAIFGNQQQHTEREERREMAAENPPIPDTSREGTTQTAEELVANSIFDAALREAEEHIIRSPWVEMEANEENISGWLNQ